MALILNIKKFKYRYNIYNVDSKTFKIDIIGDHMNLYGRIVLDLVCQAFSKIVKPWNKIYLAL